MANNLYEISVKIGTDISELDSGLKSAETKTRSTIDKLQGYVRKGFSGLNNIVNTGIKAASAAVTAAGSALLTMGVNYNRQIEDYTTNFATMLGSMEEGAAKVNELKTLAAETPFELTELADATQTLLAFNVASSESTTILRQLGDISLGNAQKLETLTRAYGKMSSSQKVSLEDINMMIDAGFNPLLIVAEETGETMSELYDRISSGEMAFSEIESAIRQATSAGGQFYKGMENASKTLSGQWSTLTDNIRATMGLLATPISDALTGHILPAANEAVNEIYEKLQQIMGESAGTPAGVEQITTNAYDWMSRLVASWSDGLKESSELVASYISEFQEDSENLRVALQERKELYEQSGQDTSTIDDYLTKLDEYDKELEALLQKRQNQMLTPEETARIEEIVTLKNEIADFLNMEAANTSLQGIVTNLGDIIGIKVADWINGFKDWLIWALDNGDEVREKCVAIGLGLAAVKTAIKGLSLLGTPAGTFALVASGVIALGAAIYDNKDEIYAFLDGFTEKITNLTMPEGAVKDVFQQTKDDLMSIVEEETGKSWLDIGLEAMAENVGGAFEGIVEFAQNAWDETTRIWGGIGQWFWDNFNAPIGEAAVDAWNKVSNAFSNAGTWFNTNVTTPIMNWFKSAWEDIKSGASTAWSNVQSAWSGASSWFSGVWSGIASGAQRVWDSIVSWANNAISKIKEFLGLQKQAQQYNVEDRPAGMSESDYVNTLLGSGVDLGNINGRHATGLAYVPWDGYRAILHKGESVLTRAQAQNWREGNRIGSAPAISAADIANAVASAVSGMRVVMDGESVGTIVAPYVSASQGESLRVRRNTL